MQVGAGAGLLTYSFMQGRPLIAVGVGVAGAYLAGQSTAITQPTTYAILGAGGGSLLPMFIGGSGMLSKPWVGALAGAAVGYYYGTNSGS